MATFEERVFISEFNVLSNKAINVRTTTEVLKDGTSISQSYKRCSLNPHDPKAQGVLGNEPFYYNLAQTAWKDVPESAAP